MVVSIASRGKYRVLIVEDESSNRKLLQAIVEDLGHEAEQAQDAHEAFGKLRLDIDIVLLDVMLPRMDGFEVARRIRETYSSAELPILMVTALSSKENRLRAVDAGADDFVTKPIDRLELKMRLNAALSRKATHDALVHQRALLEETVEKRTLALREALAETIESQRKTSVAHLDTIHRLALASGYKDEDTAQHIARMSGYCGVIARALGLPPGEVELLETASPMHDVGKIGIPDRILLKAGRLDPDEWETMKQHTLIGASILAGSSSRLLQAGELIALSHHEKWDGSGYPNGLSGEDIPLWGRISAVADVFDALTSTRPYKEAFSNEKAFEILREGEGSHFDPACLRVFFEHLAEILEVQRGYQEADSLQRVSSSSR